MTYAFVQDIASSWERYQHVTAGLIDPPPDGLILHLAGPTDEGFRIIGVWESERAWRRFQSEHLQPAVAALGGPNRPNRHFETSRRYTSSSAPPGQQATLEFSTCALHSYVSDGLIGAQPVSTW